MNVLIASDKFKGSLTASEVCRAIQTGISDFDPTAETTLLPLADGGEGTLDILEKLLDLRSVTLTVHDPLFRPVTSAYCIKGEDAYVEMARASGLELLANDRRSAGKTSSVGTGELIRNAIGRGAKNIFLFVGGSATSDGGIGMASALGFRFLDEKGKEVLPIGMNLSQIRSIVAGDFPADIKINLMTDVRNPLLGSTGASHQYAPQKGATLEEVVFLEEGLRQLSRLVHHVFGRDISEIPGCGAAGGMGLSVLGLMNGSIENGIETMLDMVGFREKLKPANLVITGEGKIDEQTLQGKVVYGVANAARSFGVPVMVVCGVNRLKPHELDVLGVRDSACIKTAGLSSEYCMKNAFKLTRQRTAELMRRNFGR